MENEEKNVVKRSNKNIVGCILILILGICLGLGIGMFITNDSKKDNTDTKEETKENNNTNSKEAEVIELEPEGGVVTELLDNYEVTSQCDPKVYLIDKVFKVNDFTNDQAYKMAIKEIISAEELGDGSDTVEITQQKLDEYVDKLFGKSYNFKHGQYSYGCAAYNYDEERKIYAVMPDTSGCGGACWTESEVKAVKAEQVGDNINVYMRKIFYGSPEDSFKIYSDFNKTNVIYEGTSDQIPDNLVEKGQLYKVVFTLEDGSYVFTSATPIAG